MKAKKLLGSIALTAALAMGTVPAFASSSAPSDWLNGTDQGIGGAGVSENTQLMNVTTDATDANKKTGTGSTAVKASVFDADLNVTVPLQLSVAFASTGGELTTPSTGTYMIKNNGDQKAVQLQRIVGTGSGGFELALTKTLREDVAKGPDAGTAGATTNNGKNMLGLVLNINGKDVDLKAAETWGSTALGFGWITEASNSSDTDLQNPFKANSTAATTTVTIQPGDNLPINLSGSTNLFTTNPLTVGYQANTICNIQYTVTTA